MRYYKYLFILFFYSSYLFSQTNFTQNDIVVCNSKFYFAQKAGLADKPINHIITQIAQSFLGVPYEAYTLEKNDKENLIVHLTGLDCYTFLENSLVLARCVKMGKTTFEDFQKELTEIRYRNGVIDEYPSRLHYFSDWIFDTDKRGIVQDVTKELGGKLYKNNVSYMSMNPDKYKHLRNNPKFVDEIAIIEKEISKRTYYYIPQDKIHDVENKIQSGDIIGITTNIKGLDIAHTGMAIWLDDGELHMLHAPYVGKRIMFSDKPLAEHILENKAQTGIMVARPLDP